MKAKDNRASGEWEPEPPGIAGMSVVSLKPRYTLPKFHGIYQRTWKLLSMQNLQMSIYSSFIHNWKASKPASLQLLHGPVCGTSRQWTTIQRWKNEMLERGLRSWRHTLYLDVNTHMEKLTTTAPGYLWPLQAFALTHRDTLTEPTYTKNVKYLFKKESKW